MEQKERGEQTRVVKRTITRGKWVKSEREDVEGAGGGD